jgi:hypothetical protein
VVIVPVESMPGAKTAPLSTDAQLAACRLPRDPSLAPEFDRVGGTRLDVDPYALAHLVARVTAPEKAS